MAEVVPESLPSKVPQLKTPHGRELDRERVEGLYPTSYNYVKEGFGLCAATGKP